MKQIIQNIMHIFEMHHETYKDKPSNQTTVCNYSNNYYQDKVCLTGKDNCI